MMKRDDHQGTDEGSGRSADEAAGEVMDEAAVRDAADAAVELSETDQPEDQRRLAGALAGVARRGAGTALRGAGTAGRGAASIAGWLSGQVLAMGPRLRIRDRTT